MDGLSIVAEIHHDFYLFFYSVNLWHEHLHGTEIQKNGPNQP